MPGLRRLRRPGRGAEADARARDPAAPRRVRVRHRLRGALLLLHGHVRDARHPRSRAGAGHRPRRGARRPLDLGRQRRRRRAVDRRQPPDPRAAPQRAAQDPDVQQPDLRPHQGAGVADLRARQGHEVDAVRRRGRAVQPARAGPRRGRDVRRPHDRPRPPSHDRRAARGRRAPRHRVRRDLPELPGLQRRRVRGADRQGAARSSTASRSSRAGRCASAPTASTAWRARPTAR